ncbi:hypothetical protein RvY_14760 [Ramazzottius varieornatus]|uniref:Phosphatidylethanolamine-binding protein n=1 Tax=Ramazzottius varieornatus TaxID=947166 RepID=A0A1D1VSJ5_RAMVA|nr:hypothetical protein RvY_14760 [Ramazzottius varieornatus]
MTRRNSNGSYLASVLLVSMSVNSFLAQAMNNSSSITAISDAFIKHNIVPDIIDQAPTEALEITYPAGKSVDGGNELEPETVHVQPATISWKAADNSLCTLSMTDLDAASRQDRSRGPINHWLVVNIPGKDVAKGDVITPYVGSRPSPNSGLHRYVTMIFKQQGKIDLSNGAFENLKTARANFDLRKFTKDHNLSAPVAGNFYQAQYSNFLKDIIAARLAAEAAAKTTTTTKP